ncbi:unnamed protein product [Ectocarpus sp. 12 AP-2014]
MGIRVLYTAHRTSCLPLHLPPPLLLYGGAFVGSRTLPKLCNSCAGVGTQEPLLKRGTCSRTPHRVNFQTRGLPEEVSPPSTVAASSCGVFSLPRCTYLVLEVLSIMLCSQVHLEQVIRASADKLQQ